MTLFIILIAFLNFKYLINLNLPNWNRDSQTDLNIYKTIILPVVLYRYETWSLTLREVSRLREFENRILRRIFGPKRNENGEWRRLHNEEHHGLYFSLNVVRVIKSRRLR